jgi:hypothetical protein
LDNLIEAVATGLDSPTTRAKIIDMEKKKRSLELKLSELKPMAMVSREILIAQLKKDADKLKEDPQCIREILKKYIVRINVSDDLIEIQSTADLSTNKKNVYTSGLAERVNTAGCGGPQHVVFIYRRGR